MENKTGTMSAEALLHSVDALRDFLAPFADGELAIVAVPRQALIALGVEPDENGCVPDEKLQFSLTGDKLIIRKNADPPGFRCDGDCENCVFRNLDCGGDCVICPCSASCDESEGNDDEPDNF